MHWYPLQPAGWRTCSPCAIWGVRIAFPLLQDARIDGSARVKWTGAVQRNGTCSERVRSYRSRRLPCARVRRSPWTIDLSQAFQVDRTGYLLWMRIEAAETAATDGQEAIDLQLRKSG